MRALSVLFLCFLKIWPVTAQPVDSEAAVEAAGQEFLLRAAEYAGYQIPATDRLKRQRLNWRLMDGAKGSARFAKDGRIRKYRNGNTSIDVSAEVFELADDLFYASFALDSGARAITLLVDKSNGRIMEIESRRPNDTEDTHRAQVTITQGQLDATDVDLQPLEMSQGMAGVRLVAHYADDIAYEHIYLNPHRVTWHGVTGPEAGFADTEWYDSYQLREGLYLVSWSEKVLTTHMIFLFNFETGHEIGTIFGYDPEYDKAVLETIGAKTDVMRGPNSQQ